MSIFVKNFIPLLSIGFFPLISVAASVPLDLSEGIVSVQSPRYSNGSVEVVDGVVKIIGSNFGSILPTSTINWSIELPVASKNASFTPLSSTPDLGAEGDWLLGAMNYGDAVSMFKNHSSELGVSADRWENLIQNEFFYFSTSVSVGVLSFDYKWESADYPGFDFPNLPIDANSKSTDWLHGDVTTYSRIDVPSWFPVSAYGPIVSGENNRFSYNSGLYPSSVRFSVTTADNFGGAGVLLVKNITYNQTNAWVNIAMEIPEPDGWALALAGALCFVPMILSRSRVKQTYIVDAV